MFTIPCPSHRQHKNDCLSIDQKRLLLILSPYPNDPTGEAVLLKIYKYFFGQYFPFKYDNVEEDTQPTKEEKRGEEKEGEQDKTE